MKKFIISLAALAAVSGTALAERNYDLRDSDTYTGKYATNALNQPEVIDNQALSAGDEASTYYFGKYGLTTDPDEARRWDEKNGG